MSDNFNRIYNGIGFRPQASDPTNPIDGDIFFSNGSPRSKGFHKWQDGQWQVLGGSGGGGLDVFFKEDHEVNGIGDYTDGNNATVDGGGTLDGTLSLDTSTEIAGSQSAKYTMGASSTNDYILGVSVALDEKQKNKEIAFTQYYKYDGADDDIKAFLYDVTNAEIIPGTTINLPAQANSKRLTIQAFIKDSIDNVKIGYQVLVGNSGKILIWDDIEGTGNPLVFTEIVSENVFSARVTSADTVTTENENFIASVVSSSTGIYVYTFVTGFFSVIPSINVTAETASLYAAIVAESTTGFTVQFRTDAGTLTDTDQAILIQRQGDDYTPPQEALLQNSTEGDNWTAYTPTITGLGTPSGIDFRWKRYGDTIRIRGYGIAGTVTAVALSVSIPSGLTIDTVKVGSADSTYKAGEFQRYNVGSTTTSQLMSLFVDVSTSTTLFYVCENFPNDTIFDKDLGSGITQTGDAFFLDILLPIANWDIENSRQLVSPLIRTAYASYSPVNTTVGGTATTGSYAELVLDTLEGDTSFISLSSNKLTIAAGTYLLKGFSSCFRTGTFKTKIVKDPSGSPSDIIIGSSAESGTADGSTTVSLVDGRFIFATSTVINLQGRADSTTGGTSGLGIPASFGEVEVHRKLEITKIR